MQPTIFNRNYCEAQARVRQGSARDDSQGKRPQSLNPSLELTLKLVVTHCRNTLVSAIREDLDSSPTSSFIEVCNLRRREDYYRLSMKCILPSPQLRMVASIRQHCPRAGAGLRFTITTADVRQDGGSLPISRDADNLVLTLGPPLTQS